MTADSAIRTRSFLGPALGFLLLVALPTGLAAGYYYLVAADRYVTEIRYSVRGGAAMPQSEGGAGGAVGGAAGLVYAGDSFILEDYLGSVQAMREIEEILPLREMLGRDGGDPVRGYAASAPPETRLAYWTEAVEVRFDAVTGVTTVEVSLFRPEDARAVGVALVANLERVVDGLSAKARDETLAYVDREFASAREAFETARGEIEAFRRDNLLVSPDEEASSSSSIISEISSEISAKQVEMRTLLQRAPDAPRIPILAEEIASLEQQRAAEYERRGTGGEAALPGQLATYEELQSAYDIARDTYVNTLTLKQQAEANATLSQAQLVVFVTPRAPDEPTEPARWLEVLKVFGIAFAVWVIGRILIASLGTQ